MGVAKKSEIETRCIINEFFLGGIMNYSEALNLSGFTGEFTEENLRKKYLELSKKYHPDMGGSDEMMKAVNTAYDTLKEELQIYVSKKVYEPGSAEEKCVNKINELVNSLPLISDKNELYLAYKSILSCIDFILGNYRQKIYHDIPDRFLKRYNNESNPKTIDEYIEKVCGVREDYMKIENTLNKIVQSVCTAINANSSVEISIHYIKNAVLNDIIDDKISLEDGVNRLCRDIMTLFVSEGHEKEL